MNAQWFWGKGSYEISQCELYMIAINLFGVLSPHILYIAMKKQNEPDVPTFSYIIKKPIIRSIFAICWFFGFFVRFALLAYVRQATGLSYLLPMMFVGWVGGQVYPVDDNEYVKNKKNLMHGMFAGLCFLSFGIMFSLYCVGSRQFCQLFGLTMLSTLFIPFGMKLPFCLLENLTMYHIAFCSVPNL